MPGVIGSLISCIVTAFATEDLYGNKLSKSESIKIDSASFNYYNLSEYAHLFKWTPREVDKGNHKLINAMSDSKIKIVSLTVTEGGYFLDENGGVDLKHPDIIHDINNPNIPKTVFGVINMGI